MLSAVKSTVPLPAVVIPSVPEITPPRTSVSPELSTVMIVACDKASGTSTAFEPDVCAESIEVKEAVLPLAAEIEYPPPVNDKDPKVAPAPRSSTFVSCAAPEGKTRFVPAPLVGGTSQLPAVDQFASAPRPVQLLVVITSRASSCSS